MSAEALPSSADVRMIQRTGGLRLAPKSCQGLRLMARGWTRSRKSQKRPFNGPYRKP
jgi:hypothetical protein